MRMAAVYALTTHTHTRTHLCTKQFLIIVLDSYLKCIALCKKSKESFPNRLGSTQFLCDGQTKRKRKRILPALSKPVAIFKLKLHSSKSRRTNKRPKQNRMCVMCMNVDGEMGVKFRI